MQGLALLPHLQQRVTSTSFAWIINLHYLARLQIHTFQLDVMQHMSAPPPPPAPGTAS